MTIQEKIKKKSEEFGKLASVFIKGAEFALNNQWISVEDDLPCNHEELVEYDVSTVLVFVKTKYSTDTDYMWGLYLEVGTLSQYYSLDDNS